MSLVRQAESAAGSGPGDWLYGRLMRVLVIEDYAPLRLALIKGLSDAGYSVDAAANGRHGLRQAQEGHHDVIVLDLMLPEMDGLTVLERVRAACLDACVLILTAKDTPADRIDGLNLGADDYLIKPFVFAEFLARVRALIRRRYNRKSPMLQVDDLCIDTRNKQVRRGDVDVDLTPREYALLEYLAHRVGEVVSRTEIWHHVYDQYADNVSNVVDVYISYLRRKIDQPDKPKLIHTRRGHGYMLKSAGGDGPP
jgi:DNA-binding response OmpR family regulator